MYIFKTNIDAKTHDDFVKQSPLCNLLQSSNWAKIKDNWDSCIAGVYQNDQLVASGLILIKHLPLSFTMMYIPRGPIMDYENKELVKFYLKELKKWAKTKHCLFISFDPAIKLREFDLDHKDKPDDQKALSIINNLQDNKAIYKGKTLKIEETIQPRFHMGLYYTDDLNSHLPKSTIKSCKAAIKRHVNVKVADHSEVEKFAKMIELTEKHKNVHLRNEEYFRKILDVYKEDATLYLADVNVSTYKKELEDSIKAANDTLQNETATNNAKNKALQTIKNSEKELLAINDLANKYPSDTIIAGGLMVGFGNTCEMLYAGRNDDFNSFRPQYYLYTKKIEHSFKQGYQYVNMGGIEGTLDDGLSKFKANFNPVIIEYVGEFDLPVMPLLYKLAKFAQKNLK
ncbi:MAG: peptidoglycan bridge formation glycyltransferase FemA/FemB family protein [Erysipelotrichaceae bacterium]|nr:peptidoglycan bridge formation glycyltransferase FemA/FemB family protein [Erysipelotrichaceae bacterium]